MACILSQLASSKPPQPCAISNGSVVAARPDIDLPIMPVILSLCEESRWADARIKVPSKHTCRVDAWKELKPKDAGLTYDGKANPMLGPYNRLRVRLDRVFCRVCSYKLSAITMVGMQPVPGVTHTKHYKKGPTTMPVLPSDHFGILVMYKYAV